MAYSFKVAKILKKLGYQWIVLDEIAIPKKNIQNKNNFYQIKGLNDFYVFFRNRKISNLFFTGKIKNSNDFFEILKKTNLKNNALITALDGENLGHHQLKMAEIWQEILNSKKLQTITYSEYLDRFLSLPSNIIEPRECSWASEKSELKKGIPFALWNNPNNEIHQLQWKLSKLAIKIVFQLKQKHSHNLKYENIRKELDQALFSCQYWWANYNIHWSFGMIKKGAGKLLKVIQMANDLNSAQKAKNLYNKIIFLAKKTGRRKFQIANFKFQIAKSKK